MVDLKLALYTKTWTWLNWLALFLFSIVIYVIFMFVGDFLKFFKSYKTVLTIIQSTHFYLMVILFSGIVIFFDLTLLSLKKELSTPLSYFYYSILRRGVEDKGTAFNTLVSKYKGKKLAQDQDDSLQQPINESYAN